MAAQTYTIIFVVSKPGRKPSVINYSLTVVNGDVPDLIIVCKLNCDVKVGFFNGDVPVYAWLREWPLFLVSKCVKM